MDGMTSWDALSWLNEPQWRVEDGDLFLRTGGGTDNWRQTHYGFVHDNGHFLHGELLGEFTASVRVLGEYRSLYDQAGLMLRAGPACWVKAGVEFIGEQQLSAVVTRDFSDWNFRPVGHPAFVDLKLTRRGDALGISARLPDADWSLLRLAYYPPGLESVVGVYACSPGEQGFEVRFSDFQVGPAEEGQLY